MPNLHVFSSSYASVLGLRARRRYTEAMIDLERGALPERSSYVSHTAPASRVTGSSFDTIFLRPSDSDYIEKQILAAGGQIV
jgi:hypothetical protein